MIIKYSTKTQNKTVKQMFFLPNTSIIYKKKPKKPKVSQIHHWKPTASQTYA